MTMTNRYLEVSTPVYICPPEDRDRLAEWRSAELAAGILLTWDANRDGVLIAGDGVEVPEGVRALAPHACEIWEGTSQGGASARGLLRRLLTAGPGVLYPFAMELWLSPGGGHVAAVYGQPVALAKLLVLVE